MIFWFMIYLSIMCEILMSTVCSPFNFWVCYKFQYCPFNNYYRIFERACLSYMHCYIDISTATERCLTNAQPSGFTYLFTDLIIHNIHNTDLYSLFTIICKRVHILDISELNLQLALYSLLEHLSNNFYVFSIAIWFQTQTI